MNTKTSLIFMTIAAAALAVVLAPSLLMSTASAAPDAECRKDTGGGTVSPKGQDEPNTPIGKADCPPPFKAKNSNAK